MPSSRRTSQNTQWYFGSFFYHNALSGLFFPYRSLLMYSSLKFCFCGFSVHVIVCVSGIVFLNAFFFGYFYVCLFFPFWFLYLLLLLLLIIIFLLHSNDREGESVCIGWGVLSRQYPGRIGDWIHNENILHEKLFLIKTISQR